MITLKKANPDLDLLSYPNYSFPIFSATIHAMRHLLFYGIQFHLNRESSSPLLAQISVGTHVRIRYTSNPELQFLHHRTQERHPLNRLQLILLLNPYFFENLVRLCWVSVNRYIDSKS